MAAAPPAAPRPGIGALFLVFAKIGLLSFGGGSSTLVLMQQEVQERRGWLTSGEFSFTYGLSRVYPGIHLLAQAVLIGYLIRGLPGALACSLGMLVPASVVTILFTAFFVQITTNPIGAAVMSGVLPATAGLTLALVDRLTREEVAQTRRPVRLITLAMILGCFVLVSLLKVNSALVVLLAGAGGALLYSLAGGVHESF